MARARSCTCRGVMSCPATFATTPRGGWPIRSEPRPPGISVMTMPPQMISSSELRMIFFVGLGGCRNRIMFGIAPDFWGGILDYNLPSTPYLPLKDVRLKSGTAPSLDRRSVTYQRAVIQRQNCHLPEE